MLLKKRTRKFVLKCPICKSRELIKTTIEDSEQFFKCSECGYEFGIPILSIPHPLEWSEWSFQSLLNNKKR